MHTHWAQPLQKAPEGSITIPAPKSESIAIARRIEQERGYPVVLDPDFAEDVEEIIRDRQLWNPASWE